MKKKNLMILAIVWLLVMVSIAASTITLLVSGRSSQGSHWVSSEAYEMIERYSKLETVRSALVENYYEEVDEDTLMTGAIRGLMAALEDPYTYYYSPDEWERHGEEAQGAYHGLGLLVQNNAEGYIEIIRVYEGSPAEDAGVCAGDLIVSVDGTEVSGESAQTLNEAVLYMKGEDGTEVALTVLRDGEALTLRVKRGSVNVSNVRACMLEGEIGYVNIYQFMGDDVDAFSEALESLQRDGARALVIDLRNNPGGLLDDVVEIADLLRPEGLIVYTQDRAGSRQDYYSDDAYCDLPLAVLINDMSASASEILAAAVQDHGRGVLVGTRSYGKGVVQTVVGFEEDGSGMQYTSSCYYTPNGSNIHGTGVVPDIVVEADEDDAISQGPDIARDAQLRAAVEALDGFPEAEDAA